MGKIKDFKLFVEGYSDDLKEVLANDENEYVIIKGEDIVAGFEYLEDAFTHLCELLEGEGSISEEQKYEFEDVLSETLGSLEDPDQYEIDEFLSDLLDKFNIIEPWSIKARMELEETPLDPTLDDDYVNGEDSELEYEEMLGENTVHEPFCIVGKFHGKEEEIDTFMSEEEANEFLVDYKTIYNEFKDMRVSSRIDEAKITDVDYEPKQGDIVECPGVGNKIERGVVIGDDFDEIKWENGDVEQWSGMWGSFVDLGGYVLESNELIFVPTKTEECSCIKKKNESVDTCDFDCQCQDEGFCSCGEDCDCEECKDMRKDDKVHMAHCNKGDFEGTCKYGSDNCVALKTNEDIDGEYFEEDDQERESQLAADDLEEEMNEYEPENLPGESEQDFERDMPEYVPEETSGILGDVLSDMVDADVDMDADLEELDVESEEDARRDNTMDYWNHKDMEEEEQKSRHGMMESKITRFKNFKK